MSKNINDQELINNTLSFLKSFKNIFGQDFHTSNIDTNMENINKEIFVYEENFFNKYHHFYYLSLIILSFLDLGLIQIIDED